MFRVKKEHLNIPNILSFYRLISFPVVLYFILQKEEFVFMVLLIFNLVTDILDGLIARKFNMQTEFGARLDSLADEGTYILAFSGIYFFKLAELESYLFFFYLFIGLYLASLITGVMKFGKLPCLHLYSSKFAAYLQGIFFFVLFVFGFNPFLFYVMIIPGIASFTEQIVIMFLSPEMKPDSKGLYWMLKKRRDGI